MGIYQKYVLSRCIDCACNTRPMMEQREEVVARGSGALLEIGIGLPPHCCEPKKVDKHWSGAGAL